MMAFLKSIVRLLLLDLSILVVVVTVDDESVDSFFNADSDVVKTQQPGHSARGGHKTV